MTIDDCVFVSEAEGNNANVGIVRTGNGGNTVALTIKNTEIIVNGEGGEKPAAALNVTTALATVVIDNCAIRATANSAVLFSQEVTTKAQITGSILSNTSETVNVISNAALAELTDCEVIGGPEAVETTPEETTPEETTPEETTPVETTPAETTPATTTPATTDAPAPAPAGGCGGISVVAQLVAVICAAAAVIIIKKK
jgi:cell division septation protein DedD